MANNPANSDELPSIEELVVHHRDKFGGDPLIAYQASLPSVVRLQEEGVLDSDIEGAFGIHLQDAHRASLSCTAGDFAISVDWLEPPVDSTSGRALSGRVTIRVDERVLYAPGWAISAERFLTALSSVVRRLTYRSQESSDGVRLDEGFDDRATQRVLLIDIGNMVLLRHGALQRVLPIRDVIGVLTTLGTAISERIQWAGTRGISTGHLQSSLKAWHSHLSLTSDERLAAITKISQTREVFRELRRETASALLGAYDWQRRPSLILETARLGSRFDDPQIRTLLRRVRQTAIKRAPPRGELREDTDAAKGTVSWADPRPFHNGYVLAQWFRKRLREIGVIPDELSPIDPSTVLRRWGVVLVVEAIADVPEIDAFAIWEEGRAPIIVLNEVGLHNEGEGGRRATIAHEICHLLVDRGSTLPVVEIKGGDLFQPIEQRANAFAAELLLPQAVVKQLATTVKDDEALLRILVEKYGVSRALATNQLTNARK